MKPKLMGYMKMECKNKEIKNSRMVEIENILKNEHGRRESAIVDVLHSTRNAEDYLRRIGREDKRYDEMKAALERYFIPVEEWEKDNK